MDRQGRPNYHKVQRFHVTFKGHIIPVMPADRGPISRMFYCHEIGLNGTPHTHAAVEYSSRLYSKPDIIKYLLTFVKTLDDQDLRNQQPDVATHTFWEPMYGYHHGFGETKTEPCSNVYWTHGDPVSPINHAKALLSKNKKPRSTRETQEVNQLLIKEDLAKLVDEGIIFLKDLPKYQLAKDLYNRLKKDAHSYVDWFTKEKRRHLWVTDDPSTGKTAMCVQLSRSASVYFKDLADSKYWEQYTGQQFVVLNDFSGSLSVSALKSLTDGLCILGVKGGSTSLYPNVVFIITSNHTMSKTFAKHFEDPDKAVDHQALLDRFHQIDARRLYDILHMQTDLISCSPTGCLYHPPPPSKDQDSQVHQELIDINYIKD